jgi:hypothetical protein
MDDLVRFGSGEYFALLGTLLLARGADFLSTWIATPHLVLEGNPIARHLGWKWGGAINVLVCLVFASWPLAAIMIATTSLLVAARNFQSAWLMRYLGEEAYRDWYLQRLREVPLALYLFCLAGQTLLTAFIGAGLVWAAPHSVVVLAVGMGLIAYALAVVLYTLLALWRIRRLSP